MEPAVLEIRLAEESDAARISSLLRESFAEYESLYTSEALAATTPTTEQVQKRMNEGDTWIAFYEDKLIGTVSTVVHEEGLYIRGMAVLPGERGTGAGRRLLEEIERRGRNLGVRRLYLSTTPFLLQAIRLYERFGFRRVEDGPHELLGTPLFTMEKVLTSSS